jgi:ethanolamine phosphate transferase 2 subunit G
MTSTASNYDMEKLTAGGCAALVATILAAIAATICVDVSIASWGPFVLVTILYGVMMFASSYVEEEQHFWYWATSAWFVYISMTQ